MRDRSREKEEKGRGQRHEAKRIYTIENWGEGRSRKEKQQREVWGAGCVEGGGAGARARVGREERVWCDVLL